MLGVLLGAPRGPRPGPRPGLRLGLRLEQERVDDEKQIMLIIRNFCIGHGRVLYDAIPPGDVMEVQELAQLAVPARAERRQVHFDPEGRAAARQHVERAEPVEEGVLVCRRE